LAQGRYAEAEPLYKRARDPPAWASAWATLPRPLSCNTVTPAEMVTMRTRPAHPTTETFVSPKKTRVRTRGAPGTGAGVMVALVHDGHPI